MNIEMVCPGPLSPAPYPPVCEQLIPGGLAWGWEMTAHKSPPYRGPWVSRSLMLYFKAQRHAGTWLQKGLCETRTQAHHCWALFCLWSQGRPQGTWKGPFQLIRTSPDAPQKAKRSPLLPRLCHVCFGMYRGAGGKDQKKCSYFSLSTLPLISCFRSSPEWFLWSMDVW